MVKKTTKKVTKVKKIKKTLPQKEIIKPKRERYFEGIGRRKTSIARVCLFFGGEKSFFINGKPSEQYFSTTELQQTVYAPLGLTECLGKFKVSVKVRGGGISSQAEAIRHGVARALVLFNPEFRKKLKSAGYLKRDPRMRERKKFGLKRARRAPQWQKR